MQKSSDVSASSSKTKPALLAGAAVLAVGAALYFSVLAPSETRKYSAQLTGDMTAELNAEELMALPHRVVPEMLATIYNAFGETQEAKIYDDLALVAAEDALESLYLERVGAMAGGGLEEADQVLHEMELIDLAARRAKTTIMMDVKWRVVGTVGHATHMHVRGNTYSANVTVKPVDGAWRMTEFDLTDVDRTDAGTQVAGE